jgi:rod shape-determining protein MreC
MKRFRHTRRVIAIGGPLVIIIVVLFLVPGGFFRIFSSLQKPLSIAGTWVARTATLSFDAATISTDSYEFLLEQNKALAYDTVELERLQRENASLKEMLGFSERQHHESIVAAVISRSVSQTQKTFLIDQGLNSGVYEGAPAITGNGVVVGKVIDVTRETATVMSLEDKSSALAASLLNETRTIGIVEGEGSGLLALRYIPQDEEIAVHQVVVTSGLEELVPSGLLVGMVHAVETEVASPFQQAIIEPLADIDLTEYVSILILSEAL